MAKFTLHGGFWITVAAVSAKVGSGRLDELDIGNPVVPRDLESSHQLFRVKWVESPCPYGGVMSEDYAFDAFNDTDANDESGAYREW